MSLKSESHNPSNQDGGSNKLENRMNMRLAKYDARNHSTYRMIKLGSTRKFSEISFFTVISGFGTVRSHSITIITVRMKCNCTQYEKVQKQRYNKPHGVGPSGPCPAAAAQPILPSLHLPKQNWGHMVPDAFRSKRNMVT